MTGKHSRAALIAHLNAKVLEQDWAAVSHAANDLNNFDILEARSAMAPRSDRTLRFAPVPVPVGA